MYASIRRYENVTDPLEVGRQVEEVYVPVVSDIPGFVAYYWVDGGDGVMFSISLFDNKDGADESNRRAAIVVREKLSKLMPKPVQITAGEVAIHRGR